MKKLWFPAFVAICGFSCAPPSGGDYTAVPDNADFGARNAAWEKDPCADYDAETCATHPMHCQCSGSDDWALSDRQTNSPTFGQEISPSSLGKVSLWGYYWANCGTCEQQFAFMQTMKDELASEGYDVEFVGVASEDSGPGGVPSWGAMSSSAAVPPGSYPFAPAAAYSAQSSELPVW